jgi:hypothetical protein
MTIKDKETEDSEPGQTYSEHSIWRAKSGPVNAAESIAQAREHINQFLRDGIKNRGQRQNKLAKLAY